MPSQRPSHQIRYTVHHNKNPNDWQTNIQQTQPWRLKCNKHWQITQLLNLVDRWNMLFLGPWQDGPKSLVNQSSNGFVQGPRGGFSNKGDPQIIHYYKHLKQKTIHNFGGSLWLDKPPFLCSRTSVNQWRVADQVWTVLEQICWPFPQHVLQNHRRINQKSEWIR